MAGSCCAVCFMVTTCFLYLSSVGPNEYGILRNLVFGSVGTDVYRGGIHLTGPTRSFVRFPATQVTLTFSQDAGADRPAVQTRTGGDHGSGAGSEDSQEGGGQPISISCALQYEYITDLLPKVYLDFGSHEAARQRSILLAANMVSNIAQRFTPQDCWTRRRALSDEMLSEIRAVLREDAKVNATRFEILNIDFADVFEKSITDVQVAEQQRVVNEYDQQVQTVEQSIRVLEAKNQAHIAAIGAQAQGLARQQIANATRDGFGMKQDAKAAKYGQLKRALGLGEAWMGQYFKIKAVQGQEGGGGKVVVGVPRAQRAAPPSPAQRAEL